MIKKTTATKLHWNYFLALEQDLAKVSRFVEFCEPNLQVFSIELAHLLFAAASEVDVLAKCICEIIAPKQNRENINDYRAIIMGMATKSVKMGETFYPNVTAIPVRVPRYGLTLTPWDNWVSGSNPDWWRGYNNVKHERNKYFHEATLQNTLNALAALLILNFYYYRLPTRECALNPKSTTRRLTPESMLLRLPEKYYDSIWAELGSIAMASIPLDS
jgi:hypothetical protein